MKILHVYKDYYPVLGGIENHIRVLAEAQVLHGHQVTVLVTNASRRTLETTLNGVRVVKAGRLATLASTPLSPSLTRALGAERPDITHLHAPYPMGELAQWLSGRGRPYIITYHADATRLVQRAILALYGPIFRQVLNGAARILITSPMYAASSPYLRREIQRTTVVPLGVDATRFRPAPHLADRPPTLLFVGLLRHYKGVDDLLGALALLPGASHLLIAGQGPRREALQALSRKLRLANRVHFLGRVPEEDLAALYQSGDVFVLPANSRAEAFGTALLEAMASGLPCVTTDVGSGTTFLVQHEVTGLVVAPRDPEKLAAAINQLLADPALRARMGAAGRERVRQHFTQAQMLDRIEALYKQVLAQPRQAHNIAL